MLLCLCKLSLPTVRAIHRKRPTHHKRSVARTIAHRLTHHECLHRPQAATPADEVDGDDLWEERLMLGIGELNKLRRSLVVTALTWTAMLQVRRMRFCRCETFPIVYRMRRSEPGQPGHCVPIRVVIIAPELVACTPAPQLELTTATLSGCHCAPCRTPQRSRRASPPRPAYLSPTPLAPARPTVVTSCQAARSSPFSRTLAPPLRRAAWACPAQRAGWTRWTLAPLPPSRSPLTGVMWTRRPWCSWRRPAWDCAPVGCWTARRRVRAASVCVVSVV